MTRKRALAAIALVMLALFAAGFAATWVMARNDKNACRAMPLPPGAAAVHVQHQDNGRSCVWVDRRSRTIAETPLP
jgi:hypothetical protein